MLWQFYGAEVAEDVVSRNFCESLRGGPVQHWGHHAAFRYPMAERLPQVGQEILVLNPDDDLALQTPRVQGLMKNGRIYDLPYAHGMLDAHTAEIAAILREFLARWSTRVMLARGGRSRDTLQTAS